VIAARTVAWETPSASILSRFERSNSNAIAKLWFARICCGDQPRQRTSPAASMLPAEAVDRHV